MPLDQSCTKYAGETLVVKPLHGWGWRSDDPAFGYDDYGPIDAAGSITFRVSEFLEWRGELRHVIGSVESQHFLFTGLWITCAVMQTGVFDFRERLCLRYDLSFGPLSPAGEWPLAAGSPRWEGYGVIAESEQIIDAHLASLTQGA
jgi:hypothetical protein